MTLPTPPDGITSGEMYRAIGRMEKATDELRTALGAKIDDVGTKLGGHAETLVRHEQQIQAIREDLTEIRDAGRHKSGMRGNIAATVAGGVSGTALAALLQLVMHR